MFDITSVEASTYAAILTYASAVLSVICFSTPYWLASDGRQPVVHFNNLGLWEGCFTSFRDSNYLYDREFKGCKWLYDEDYDFLANILRPPFFITTQVLYTIGFVLLLLSVISILAIQLCFIVEKEIYAIRVIFGFTSLSSAFLTAALIIFGIRGDDREWMPDPEHNYLSWSFALGVIGAILLWFSAVLFWVQIRVLTKRSLKSRQTSFKMEQAQFKA